MLDWLWSCSRVREQVRVTVRMRPSFEACTVPRSHEHWVKGGRPGWKMARCSDESGETHFRSIQLGGARNKPQRLSLAYLEGQKTDCWTGACERGPSMTTTSETDVDKRKRQELSNGSWESSMGSTGSLRRSVGGERGTAPVLVDSASVSGWTWLTFNV
jgi:hypothetical protein